MGAFPSIKGAKVARTNLETTVQQIDFFASIPRRVRDLRASLRASPLALKRVHRRAIELEVWRGAFEAEVHAASARARLAGAAEDGATGSVYSPEFLAQVRSSLYRARSPSARIAAIRS